MPDYMRRAASVATLSLFIAFGVTPLLAADTDKPAMTAPKPGKLTFFRLYTSADGNSHFADETVDLQPLNGRGPEAHLTAARVGDTKNAMILSLPAGAVEDYHVAPRRQLMICLRGVV